MLSKAPLSRECNPAATMGPVVQVFVTESVGILRAKSLGREGVVILYGFGTQAQCQTNADVATEGFLWPRTAGRALAGSLVFRLGLLGRRLFHRSCGAQLIHHAVRNSDSRALSESET